MSTIYVLIGLPGSGKSTWTKNAIENLENVAICSTDNMIEEWATNHPDGPKTYSEAFDIAPLKDFENQFFRDVKWSCDNGMNVIIDRTNMTAKTRQRILSLVPETYKKVAVVFNVNEDELKRRLEERAKATGKNIPDEVIARMRKYYEKPYAGEFDEVIKINF